MTLLRICVALFGLSAFAVGSAVICRRRHRTPPEQLEALRRQRIGAHGRVTDGTVLEVQEQADDGPAKQIVLYSYQIAGVGYHCAQDLTALGAWLDLRACCLGPASIKYDPRSPGDSIVAAEGWCGLRKASQPRAGDATGETGLANSTA
jgi:hypothetical protein